MKCPECGEDMFKSPDGKAYLCPNCEKRYIAKDSQNNSESNGLIIIFKLALLLLAIICIIVIIVDCTKPISYGVAYYNQSKTGEGHYVFYRNNTFKYIAYSSDGQKTKNIGTYSISQQGDNKKIILGGSTSYAIISRTHISNSYNEYKSSASDGIITCSVFLVLSVVVLAYLYLKYKDTKFRKKK